MAYDIRSISQVGTSEPFELQVARGQIPGHSVRNIFGQNPAIGSTFTTPWEVAGPLPFLSAEQNLSLVSTVAGRQWDQPRTPGPAAGQRWRR